MEVSAEFEEFCQILGDRVELLGWEGFRGGLDTKRKRNREYRGVYFIL